MDQLQLLHRGVAAFDLIDAFEKPRIVAQRAGYGTKAADVLWMRPAGIVPAAIRMRNERDPVCSCGSYRTALRRRRVSRSVDPFLTPTNASDASSWRISNP